jgi:hypothetical protein
VPEKPYSGGFSDIPVDFWGCLRIPANSAAALPGFSVLPDGGKNNLTSQRRIFIRYLSAFPARTFHCIIRLSQEHAL